MSRIGKKPLTIPSGVTVQVTPSSVLTKGPKGELSLDLSPYVSVAEENGIITVSKVKNGKQASAMWGTTTRLIQNMMSGVLNGFEKKLELNGVGFRMSVQGKKLNLTLGFSHPVSIDIPSGIEAVTEENILTIRGCDRQAVGKFAAEIKSMKPVEPYKGKGFRYVGEVVRKKEGKKAGTAA